MTIRTIYRMLQALKFVPLVVLFSAALAAQTATQPQRIILTLTADPAHSMAITWRSAQAEATPAVQVAVASAAPNFFKDAATVPATPKAVANTELKLSYSAVLQGLKPDTQYLYRVGRDGAWSEWNVFRTAQEKPAPFRFLYVGDAQNSIHSLWSHTIRAAYAAAPDARFIVHAGDLVAEGFDDKLWGEWHDSLGFIAATMPSLPVVGNHDLHLAVSAGDGDGKVKNIFAAPLWTANFTLPANGPAIAETPGQSYYVDYQGVRFIALDANVWANDSYLPEQRERVSAVELKWLEELLKTNPNRWTIVVQHQSPYSVGKDRDYDEMRAALVPLFDKYHVDLVLMGHDHCYARTRRITASKPAANGTVYVISVSGPKMYKVSNRHAELMEVVRENTQMYQVVDVEGDHLKFSAYDATGVKVDEFTLDK
jgi:3',5'-cyclic AMP phosphodiesterase CpdA